MDYRQRAAELYRDAVQPTPDTRKWLVRSLSDAEPLVRHVAAIALAKCWPEQRPERSIRELLDTLAQLEYLEKPRIESEYAEASDTGEDCESLGQEIVRAFAELRCGQAEYMIPRLLEFWSFDSQFYELAHAMIALAFPITDGRVDPKSLGGVQYRILQALAAGLAIWSKREGSCPPAPRHARSRLF